MNRIILILTLLFLCVSMAFSQDYKPDILDFQKEMNQSFANPEESPLTAEDLKQFKGLDFFPIDETYKVEARFVLTKNSQAFKMKTSTDRLPVYTKYAEVFFKINGTEFKLNVYQSENSKNSEAYKNFLFLPFTDASNGTESYGGGRYIDLLIPEGNQIIIDFNKAYNPSCTYNHKYSCPTPPIENDLDIKILAGVKAFDH